MKRTNKNIFPNLGAIVANDPDLRAGFHFVTLHEIGHALGLRHPHGDGNHPDWDDNDSVMSYIDGDSDALFFTDLDIKALQEIWGIEDDLDAVDRLISSLSGFNKKSADKITNFNPATDTMEIDVDSFGIDSSATFASGKNKKAVKKKLAKQDFDFLYDEKKGGLYFNENGSDKGFGDGGIIAILKGAPELTSGNLEFI